MRIKIETIMMVKYLSLNNAIASKHKRSRIEKGAPALLGGVCGKVKLYTPMTIAEIIATYQVMTSPDQPI